MNEERAPRPVDASSCSFHVLRLTAWFLYFVGFLGDCGEGVESSPRLSFNGVLLAHMSSTGDSKPLH